MNISQSCTNYPSEIFTPYPNRIVANEFRQAIAHGNTVLINELGRKYLLNYCFPDGKIPINYDSELIIRLIKEKRIQEKRDRLNQQSFFPISKCAAAIFLCTIILWSAKFVLLQRMNSHALQTLQLVNDNPLVFNFDKSTPLIKGVKRLDSESESRIFQKKSEEAFIKKQSDNKLEQGNVPSRKVLCEKAVENITGNKKSTYKQMKKAYSHKRKKEKKIAGLVKAYACAKKCHADGLLP